MTGLRMIEFTYPDGSRYEGPACECCGGPVSEIHFTKGGEEATAVCGLCDGLVAAGMLRREIVDGEVRYRQWYFEWKPGALLPRPKDRA